MAFYLKLITFGIYSVSPIEKSLFHSNYYEDQLQQPKMFPFSISFWFVYHQIYLSTLCVWYTCLGWWDFECMHSLLIRVILETVKALNSIFQKWDIEAAPLWNISGEPCSGSAINGTEFENEANNPAIKCDCSYDDNTTCHITQLYV